MIFIMTICGGSVLYFIHVFTSVSLLVHVTLSVTIREVMWLCFSLVHMIFLE